MATIKLSLDKLNLLNQLTQENLKKEEEKFSSPVKEKKKKVNKVKKQHKQTPPKRIKKKMIYTTTDKDEYVPVNFEGQEVFCFINKVQEEYINIINVKENREKIKNNKELNENYERIKRKMLEKKKIAMGTFDKTGAVKNKQLEAKYLDKRQFIIKLKEEFIAEYKKIFI